MVIQERMISVLVVLTILSSVSYASITVPFINNMLLGRTFDYSKSEVGNDIFTAADRQGATVINHAKSDIKYKVAKSSEDMRDILDISGQLSLKVMGGLVDVEGKGSYLKSSLESDSAVEVMARIYYRTVTKTITDDTAPIATWQTRPITGKHYIRSLTYGGYLIASFKFHSRDESRKEEIKASIEANVNTAKLNLGVKAQFEHIANSVKDLSTLTITYSSTVISDAVPVDLDTLHEVIKNFSVDIQKIKGGNGVPIEAEIRELAYLANDDSLSFVKNSIISQKMDMMATMFHDLKITSDALKNAVRDNDLTVQQEEIYGQFNARISGIQDVFYMAIQNMDLNAKTADSNQFSAALNAYKEGKEYFLPGKFLREFRKLLDANVLGNKEVMRMGVDVRDTEVKLKSLERLFSGQEVDILFHTRSGANFLMSGGSPTMNSIMVCFSAKPSTNGSVTYISYATEAHANEFKIFYEKRGKKVVVIRRTRRREFRNLDPADKVWHSWCFYWDESGVIKVYKDGAMASSSTSFSANLPIKAGGTWIVGQDQGSVGGSFNQRVSYRGRISNVNIYGNVRRAVFQSVVAVEMSKSRCRPTKNKHLVKSWNDFKLGVVGDLKIKGRKVCKV